MGVYSMWTVCTLVDVWDKSMSPCAWLALRSGFVAGYTGIGLGRDQP